MVNDSKSAGFTLIELVVVIGIAAILMSIAVPSYKYVTTSNRVAGELNGLLGDMQFARIEAIKEGQTVTLCPSTTGSSCLASTAWNSGWIVFSDVNNDQTVDPGDTVLRVQVPFANSNSTDTLTANNGVQAVTFNREGFASGLAGTVILSLHDVTNNSSYTRCLELSATGLLTTVTFGVSGCT